MSFEDLLNRLYDFVNELNLFEKEINGQTEMIDVLGSCAKKHDVLEDRFIDAIASFPRKDFVDDFDYLMQTGQNIYDFAYPTSISKDLDIEKDLDNFIYSMHVPQNIYSLLFLLNPSKKDNICEFRTNEGYLTCLLGKLAKKVISVQPNPKVNGFAKKRIEKYNLNNVVILENQESMGLHKNKNYSGYFDKVISGGTVLEKDEKLFVNFVNKSGKMILPIYNNSDGTINLFMSIKENNEIFKVEVFKDILYPNFVAP